MLNSRLSPRPTKTCHYLELCPSCGMQIANDLEKHYNISSSCLKWKNIMDNDKEGRAKFIQNNLNMMTLNESTVCINCKTEYSNIGI